MKRTRRKLYKNIILGLRVHYILFVSLVINFFACSERGSFLWVPLNTVYNYFSVLS